MKQKTAIQEFLEEIILKQVKGSVYLCPAIMDIQIQKALEKERKQIEDAFSAGESNNEFHDVLFTDKEAYFNENFETEQP
jgi:hypothetical protein